MRFRRISYPILPGCREAPTTAIDRGEKTASRPAPIIFAAKLPGVIEPSRGAWRCIITLGNRALRLIYRDENPGVTAHARPRSEPDSHGEPTFRPASKDRGLGHLPHDCRGGLGLGFRGEWGLRGGSG